MNIPRCLRAAIAVRRSPLSVARHRRGPACVVAGLAVLLPLAPAARTQTLDPRATPQESVNTSDPSEVFLKAYTSVQQADKLEQDGKRAPALAKYRFAASLLEQLTQTNPNWQPLIVKYRLRNTTDTIRRLEEKGSLQAATPAPGMAVRPGVAPDADDLPAPDNNAVPPNGLAASADAAALDRTVADLKAKLGKTQKDLKAALDNLSTAQKEKKDALAAAEKDKKDALTKADKEKGDALAKAEKEKKTLTRARDEADDQLKTTRNEAQATQKKFDQTKTDRDQIQAELSKAQDRLKELSVKGPDAIQTRKELRDQVADLKKQLARAQTDVDSVAKTREEYDTRVAEGERKIAELTKERDTAVAQAESTRDARERIESLTGQNTALTQQLTDAEKRIANLTEESVKKKEELAGMQQELTGLRDQLASSRDQNDRSATTITELRQQLDDGAKKLEDMKAKGMTGDDFARMTKENELLRGIVLRQLKDQSRRMAARKLLNDELAKLDVQNSTLNAQVEELGRPTTQLTDEERALFKDPQDVDAGSTSMAVTISSVASNRQAPDATPPPDAGPAAADATASDRNAQPEPLPDDHQARAASNRGSGGTPKVTLGSQPLVSDELLPMAREAQDAFARGKYTDAERTYDKLLSRDPKNPYLLSNQGVVLFRQDKLKSAEVVLRKALAVTPKDAFCLATLGIVYYRMHRYDDALNYLTQAIQLDPRNATAHNYLGITSSQKGWPEAALEEIQKAITINPNYADAHFNIAVIYATNQPPSKEQAQMHYKIATSLGATPDPTLEKMIQ